MSTSRCTCTSENPGRGECNCVQKFKVLLPHIRHERLWHTLHCDEFNGFLLARFDDSGPATTSHFLKEVIAVHLRGCGRQRDKQRVDTQYHQVKLMENRNTGAKSSQESDETRDTGMKLPRVALCSQILASLEVKAVWSSGMILRLGRRGRGFDPRNRPSFFFSFFPSRLPHRKPPLRLVFWCEISSVWETASFHSRSVTPFSDGTVTDRNDRRFQVHGARVRQSVHIQGQLETAFSYNALPRVRQTLPV
jgi:hypothetical protein